MTIVWDAARLEWFVVEDEVEIAHFARLSDAETWVIEESERREVQP